MNSATINELEFRSQLNSRLLNIKQLSNSGALILHKHLVNDSLQKVLISSKRKSWFDNTILPMIESASIDAEKSAPGAGLIVLKLITSQLTEDLKEISNSNLEIELLKEHTSSAQKICTKEEFEEFRKKTLSKHAYALMTEILEKYNLGDDLETKKSYLRDTTIEKIEGYTLDNIIFNQLFLKSGTWTRSDVNVLIIDGLIESVGEIYHLLEKANKTSESYLVICAGILQEPLNVILQNFARETIDVVVGTIKSSDQSINTIADLGTICMTSPISAMKGETISQATLHDFQKLDKVSITQNRIQIKNSKAKIATTNLLRELIKKSQQDIDVDYLLQKRIKCLSSSRLSISIGRDDVDKQKNIIEEIDTFLRSCPMILSNGFLHKNELKNFSDNIIELLFGETDAQPVVRIEKAISIYKSFFNQIKQTGTIITEDRS